MSAASQATERIVGGGVLAILRGRFTGNALPKLARAIVAAGVPAIELTLNSHDALNGIEVLQAEFGDEVLIGAGTVRTAEDAQRALGAGARFLVSPNFDLATVRAARDADALHVPGVFTATEAQAALDAGSLLLKLFPADVGGPHYLRSLLGPLDDAKFLPTGGVGVHNAGAFIEAGAAAVAIGGELTRDYPDLERVAAVARQVVAAVDECRGRLSHG